MPSKLLLACLAIFVILPATADATNTPELTYPTGTRLAAASTLKGVNVGEVKFTGSGETVACTSAAPTGTLGKNSGTEFETSLNEFSLTGTGGAGRCTGATVETAVSVSASCMWSGPELSEDEFQIRGASCSKATAPLVVTFKKLEPAFECVYERSGAISGTFTTHPEDAVFTVKAMELSKVSGSLTCFSVLKLDSSFTFEKNEAGANPLYISAGPTLTFPTGTKYGTGGSLRGRTIGSIKLTGSSGETLLECQSGETTGILRKNSGSEIEADIEGASYSGTGAESTCTSSTGYSTWTFNSATNGLPWCLRATSAMAADEFQIRGNNCAGGSRPIRIITETKALMTACVYERKAAITGTYATHPADALLTLEKTTLLEAEPRKSTCVDETQVDGSFTLEKDEAGTSPMYIS